MKTTLVIDDGVLRRLKAAAAREGRTLSHVVEAALRLFLERVDDAPVLPELPSWRGGSARVDVGDRGALDGAMDVD